MSEETTTAQPKKKPTVGEYLAASSFAYRRLAEAADAGRAAYDASDAPTLLERTVAAGKAVEAGMMPRDGDDPDLAMWLHHAAGGILREIGMIGVVTAREELARPGGAAEAEGLKVIDGAKAAGESCGEGCGCQ